MTSKNVKIAFDVSDLATDRADGTTRYTKELVKRLPALSPNYDWQLHAPGDFDQPDVHGNTKKILSPWPKYWTQSRFPVELIKHKPDVLFMPIQQLPFLRPHGLKTVTVIHDLAFHKYSKQITHKDWLLLHVFTAYAARTADYIIAVSQATADDIARYYGRVTNVSVVHHGLDHQQFRLPAEKEKEQSWIQLKKAHPTLRNRYILYVGQIQPRKNLIRLIEAFELLAKTDKDLQLVIAGAHGWLQQQIFDRVTESQFADRIFLPGRVDDALLPAFYWHAQAYVLASLYEGFGMPILEAMACGCPVVTSNVSSMPEVAGSAAAIIDPLNVQSIATGITTALNKREELKRKGLEQAQKFTWEKTAQQTMEVLSNVIQK